MNEDVNIYCEPFYKCICKCIWKKEGSKSLWLNSWNIKLKMPAASFCKKRGNSFMLYIIFNAYYMPQLSFNILLFYHLGKEEA